MILRVGNIGWQGCFAVLFFGVLLCNPQDAYPAQPKPPGLVSTARSRAARSSFELPFKIKSIKSSDTVAITVGSYSFSVPGSSFKFSKKKKVFGFTGKKGSLGISGAVLDPGTKTFRFTVQGVSLIDENFPLRVEATIGSRLSCSLLGGKGKGSIAKGALKLSRLGKCPGVGEALSSTVGLLPLGVSTDTVFRLRTLAPISQGAVYTSDRSGRSLRKICDLSDSGERGVGDVTAGDGSYSCRVLLTPGEVSTQYYVAKGKRSGTVVFPGLSLRTVGAITEQDAKAANVLQGSALNLWFAVKSALGTGITARLEAIQQILTLPGVAGATLAPNGVDIVITLNSGLDVILVLNTKPAPQARSINETALSREALRFGEADGVSGNLPAIQALSSGGVFRIFLYDPGYFPDSENETVLAFASAADPSKVSITSVQDSAAQDVNSLSAITGHDLIVLTTHGSIDLKGRVGFAVPLRDEAQIASYMPLLSSGKIVLSGTENIGPGIGHSAVLVMPDYFANLPGSFDGASVIGSSCYSAANATMAEAFLAKGAAGYFGFDEVVFSDFAADRVLDFMCSTLVENRSIGEAYNSFDPKTDSRVYTGSGVTHLPATVRFVGNPGALVTSDSLFDNFQMSLTPTPALLFFGEKVVQNVSIGGPKLPPCMKFRTRNGSSEMVSIERKLESGATIAISGDELFSESKLQFTARDKSGVPDLSVYIVEEQSGEIVGQKKAELEVLCQRPTVGALVPQTDTVDIGQEAKFNFSSLSDAGCNTEITFLAFRYGADGNPSGDDPVCGLPLNPEAKQAVIDDLYKWQMPVSALPIRLKTASADCPRTTRLVVSYQIRVRGNLYSDINDAARLFEMNRESSVTLNKNNELQVGNFETKILSYTRNVSGLGPIQRHIAFTIPFITPPTPGQNGRYCVQVDRHGVAGPANQEQVLPFPATTEYFVVSENPCLRFTGSATSDYPTEAECDGAWSGGKLGLWAFGSPPTFGLSATIRTASFTGCTGICTPEQIMDYFAPIRQWTFKARRLTGTETNCGP